MLDQESICPSGALVHLSTCIRMVVVTVADALLIEIVSSLLPGLGNTTGKV